ncbi:hypothetical protein [Parachlamydia sp. AcF125]|uniref:hypothetical protein n=1 Tax=Parachlamydia sp. AcF125 TaxID=2795736 RepID=UPI001BC92A70|nr:hypothetical protein [Parachlamydia sp. AcF125]MBS4167405.1 hypothetical protein [Parachlamydia sp. AcF125]
MPFSKIINTRSVLISSEGGSGHKIAALAVKSRYQGSYYELDTFATLGKIGKACTERWNQAQKRGDIKTQIKLANYQGLAEALFSIPIYFRVCYVLLRHNIDQIIDTQAIGTRSIIRAARTVNFIYKLLRKKERVINVWKIFIELPTSKSLYYHRYIKKLSKKDKKIFKLVSIKPPFKTIQEEEDFWQKYCNLSVLTKEVVYADPPIRKEFLTYKNLPSKPQKLAFAVNTEEELHLLQSIHNDLEPDPSEAKNLWNISIKNDDIVMTLMLGSQVAEKATLNYVSRLFQAGETIISQDKKIYFFVYCNKHIPQQETLFKKVVDLVKTYQKTNPNIKVVPLTFQNASEIAPMMYRSDFAIIRTGAQASQEAKSSVQGQILIHSENTDENISLEDQSELLKGIPLWEGGNAEFLINTCQAKIVNPSLFKEYLTSRLTTHSCICQ